MHLVITAALAVPLLLVLRICLILPSRSDRSRSPRRPGETCALGVFLGSGGHTSEIRALLSGVDFARYTPRIYVYCPGDEMSLRAVRELEATKQSNPNTYSFVDLPRARRVAQPLTSTVRTASITLISALYLFFLRPLAQRPAKPWVDVLLVNGPGTCVLVVAVCWIRRFLGLSYTRIIYVESFARVKSLSLSGRILRPFVDTFVVQWPAEGQGATAGTRVGREGSAAAEGAKGVAEPIRTVYKGWLV